MIGATLPLIEYCHSKGIAIAAFSVLASLTHFSGGSVDKVAREIASRINATEDQVLLKWAHQVTKDGIVLTASQRCDRLQGQIRALEEMEPLPRVSDGGHHLCLSKREAPEGLGEFGIAEIEALTNVYLRLRRATI